MKDAKALWVEELPSTLWAISMIVHLGTRDTPFNLTFGMDTIIFVEVVKNTFWIRHFDPSKNEDNNRTNMDLPKEARKKAIVRAATRKMQVA